jgi:hypothetical protein
MSTITESPKSIPVIQEVDIVVAGGSCTGVFAAVRAARLGAKVAIIERTNAFGGVATTGMVCIWHSLYDTTFKKQIVAGLTNEVFERLRRIPYALDETFPAEGEPFRMSTIMNYRMNTEELKIELDKMLLEANVTPYLHTQYVAPYVENGKLTAVIIENKSGRSAIKAKYFVDATADGDLGMHMGMDVYRNEGFQPATTSGKVYGWDFLTEPNKTLHKSRDRIGCDIGWNTYVAGTENVQFWAKSNVVADCADGNGLTHAEIAARGQIREMMNILREQDPAGKKLVLLSLSSAIGVRETRQLRCTYHIEFDDIRRGKEFDDAVVYCAYPPDIHHHDKAGATYWYLDGVKEYTVVGAEKEFTRWRDDNGPYPTYWQIPYRALLPEKIDNLVICGRAIDADKGAFAATRIMISMNQTGEAAGVAAYEALSSGKPVQNIDIRSMRRKMKQGGSIVFND